VASPKPLGPGTLLHYRYCQPIIINDSIRSLGIQPELIHSFDSCPSSTTMCNFNYFQCPHCYTQWFQMIHPCQLNIIQPDPTRITYCNNLYTCPILQPWATNRYVEMPVLFWGGQLDSPCPECQRDFVCDPSSVRTLKRLPTVTTDWGCGCVVM